MEKFIWSEATPEYSARLTDLYGGHDALRGDAKGLDTARGLLIGLAISQVFWLVLAAFVL
jgi:hypothetical protein